MGSLSIRKKTTWKNKEPSAILSSGAGTRLDQVLSYVGQADGVCLMSTIHPFTIFWVLLELTEMYYRRFHVKLVPNKTKQEVSHFSIESTSCPTILYR